MPGLWQKFANISPKKGDIAKLSVGICILKQSGCCLRMVHGFCVKVEDYTLCDQEYHVDRKVWIISGPSKGYRGTLRSGMLLNGTPLDSTRMAAFIALCQNLFAEIAPPPCCATPPLSLSAVDPLAEPGPSTLTSNPWIVNTDDVAMPHPNKTEKQQIDYGIHTRAWSCTSWSFVSHHDLKYELTGQIFWVKKCQSKKEPRGVELEDGTKLQFGDIYYVGLAVKMYTGDNIPHSF
ncbi:hypothetical protein BKA83DRAFT_4131271 [Pisolithus microcarpus]|nr:hypothetical protein BKA83DRAFT_4131271 [Pisolithus microcarpus]